MFSSIRHLFSRDNHRLEADRPPVPAPEEASLGDNLEPLLPGDIVCMMRDNKPTHSMLIVDDETSPLVHSSASNRVRGAVQQSMKGLAKENSRNTTYEVFRLDDESLKKILPAVDFIAKRVSVKTSSAQFKFHNATTPRQHPIELQMPFGKTRLDFAKDSPLQPLTNASLFRAIRAYFRAEFHPMRPYKQPSFTNVLGETVPEKEIDEIKSVALSKNKGLSCSQFLTLIFQAAIIKTGIESGELEIAPRLAEGLKARETSFLKAKDLSQESVSADEDYQTKLSQTKSDLTSISKSKPELTEDDLEGLIPIFSWDVQSTNVSHLYAYLKSEPRFKSVGLLDLRLSLVRPNI